MRDEGGSGSELAAAIERSDMDASIIWYSIIVDYLYSLTVEPMINDGLKAVGDHLLSIAGLWFWLLVAFICWALPYILFQKHALGHFAAKHVGRCYFWPCVPCSIYGNHVEFKGEWWAYVDDEQPAVLLGQVPLFSEQLHTLEAMGVKAIINLQDEYKGPTRHYRRNGVSLLWLRTVDHLEPTVEALRTACSFIEHHRKRGSAVYIHCKSGRGRSAAVAMAWLMHYRKMDVMSAQKKLLSVRKVRAKLWKQKNIIEFHEELKNTFTNDVEGGGGMARSLSYATTAPPGQQTRRKSQGWSVAERPPDWEGGGEFEVNVAPLEAQEQADVAWIQNNLDGAGSARGVSGTKGGSTRETGGIGGNGERSSLVSTHL